MSNYWNTLSPIHSLLTKRESHAKGGSVGGMGRPKYLGMNKGGKVDQGGKPVKRIILWKGKAKNWPGAKKAAQQTKNKKAEGGRIAAKDGKWIQKATASIKKRGTEGKCTPITKKGCTGRAKALAKTFKKIAKKRKAA